MAENINYTERYLNGEIKLKEIPLYELTSKLLHMASKNDSMEYVDVIFKLYELDNSIDLIYFASLLQTGTVAYYRMYERIFDVNPTMYFDLIPEDCKTAYMWNKMMVIDLEKYFPLVPDKYINSNVYDMLLKLNFDKYIDIIPVKFITPNMCKYIYQKRPEKLFDYIGLRILDNFNFGNLLTVEMCKKLCEINMTNFVYNANYVYLDMLFDSDPVYYFSVIPKPKLDLHMCNKMFKMDSEKYFVEIPMDLRTEEMCSKMFELNPEKYFLEIPLNKRDLSMCRKIFDIDPEKFFTHIPHVNRTKEMCERMFEISSEKYFYLIPSCFRTKEMCEEVAKLDLKKYFELIPHKHRTKEMWIEMFKMDSSYVFKYLPKKFKTEEMFLEFYKIDPNYTFVHMDDRWKTQEMCNKYFEYNNNTFEYYIPKKMFTSDMYKRLLKKNFSKYYRSVPDEMIDDEMIAIAKIEMDKMIGRGELIDEKKLSKIMLMVIKLYPECKNIIAMPEYTEEEMIIKNELYSLINNGGTVEGIAEKYAVSVSLVQSVLERIKREDLVNYNAIKDVLEINQRGYFFTIMRDVKNLSMIIDIVGNIDVKGISLEQKLKFSYLCNKYLSHNLEEIYSFNYSKYTNEDYSNIKRFFNRVLKYNFVLSENVMIPEKKTIQFNNGWIRKYNRDKFFAIKNGKVTMERRYGKNSELLTIDIEEKIINILKSEGIPLNDVIVTTAFKEYFNGNLALYIEKLKGFSAEFEDVRKNINGMNK